MASPLSLAIKFYTRTIDDVVLCCFVYDLSEKNVNDMKITGNSACCVKYSSRRLNKIPNSESQGTNRQVLPGSHPALRN